jgi:hypothetical protein
LPDSDGKNVGETSKKLYYVHYIDYNKRLDEWVTIERMKVDKLQPPVMSASAQAAVNAANAVAAAAAASKLTGNQKSKEETTIILQA